ncbi:hypothetical protein [Halobacteriovorax sp. HLS]|uniref:hypothetical protein n=1 Tax=Halobacteriovorax sp. HLS TaxID=2234000 RepID=UPI000FDA7F56|nr:hypothetical protein [Halobacteriovorax sp. HLS]
MATTHPFKGKIKIYCDTSKETQLNFNLPEEELPLCDSLMSCYSNLKLTKEEKKELSIEHRKIIHQYQSLDDEVILKYVDKFINALPISKKKIKIETSDFGSYICLAALHSGKIPQDLKLSFELEDSPVELFPKKFVKKALTSDTDVKFTYNEDSWVAPFKTLYKACA